VTQAELEKMARDLRFAWQRYLVVFSGPPQGTQEQLCALLHLLPGGKGSAAAMGAAVPDAAEPQPPVLRSMGEADYFGVRYVGAESYVYAQAEYFREWQAWARRELAACHAFEARVNEALNSGTGVYKP
jgi:hypothetical protein